MKLTAWIIFLSVIALSAAAEARDSKPVAAFRQTHACPSTQKFTGPCPGWVVDHVVPLCWGGADLPLNMQWQDRQASYRKDAFERAACAMKKQCGAVK